MKIPESVREIFLRADRGFYDSEFLYYLEMRNIVYAIVVKLYPWIQIELVGLKYRDIGGGISVGEMRLHRDRMEGSQTDCGHSRRTKRGQKKEETAYAV